MSTADLFVDTTVSSVGRPFEEPLKSPAFGRQPGGEYRLLRVWKANWVQSWFDAVVDAGGVGRGF